jgi:hypothetical protein
MTDAKKTTMYLEQTDLDKIEEIKKSIGTTKDVAAVRFAIRNVRLPKK